MSKFCKYGHDVTVFGRYRRNCNICKKERDKKYRQEHKTEMQKLSRRWRQEHPEARTWYDMKTRCNNPKCESYPWYGGKEIKCKFKSWHEIVEDIGYMPRDGKCWSIDRIDPNKHYEKGNVRWLLSTENSRRGGRAKKPSLRKAK